MPTTEMGEWIERLQAGTMVFKPDTLAQLQLDELIRELSDTHPVLFLDRSIGEKREIGMAQRQRQRIHKCWRTRTLFECLFLTAERGVITTLAESPQLRCRFSAINDECQLTTGAGYSVFHAPDGWSVKPLRERTVVLNHATLQRRGWRLNGDGGR